MTEAPPSGALVGYNALDGSEWVALEGERRRVVLFGISQDGETGDAEFWRDVASHSLAAMPDIQYVGLCLKGGPCKSSPGAEGMLTLLSAMDPVQMHALAIASRQRRFLLYRASGLHSVMPIQSDRQALAADIVAALSEKSKVGGA